MGSRIENEYIIINKTAIEKRIEELEKIDEKEIWEHMEYDTLNHILSQSTSLIPEIEKAFDAGSERGNEEQWEFGIEPMDKEDYISNLKLDI